MSAFFVRIHEATEGIFLVTFFCLVNLVTFLFVCFAKESSSQFLFFHFFVKKKEKKTMDLFFTFLLMIPSCKLCFDDFFFFVRSFVCLLVCCNPGKTITTTKEKLKRERKRKRKQKSYDTSVTTLCSALLSLYSR